MSKQEIINRVLGDCKQALELSYKKFPDFNSYHEGYAVLKEEVDELWEEIKNKHKSTGHIRLEAEQVAAMAMKILIFIQISQQD